MSITKLSNVKKQKQRPSWIYPAIGSLIVIILVVAAVGTLRNGPGIIISNKSCDCADSIKYTGIVEDCCCDYETLDSLNDEVLHPILKAIGREAKEFELGEEKYYIVLVASALFWQLFFLGIVGVISASSSLHAGVLLAALIPVTEVMAVFFFKEKFSTEKGLSLVLSLWGFASYFYGEWMKLKKEMGEKKKTEETQKPVLETET